MRINNDTPLLEIRDLKMHFPLSKGLLGRQYGVVKAVDGVSLSIKKGQTLGLVGESGCGKTTTGKCILRICKATEGEILYKGQDLRKMSEREFSKVRRKLQLIFQDPYGSIDPRQSAASVLREVLMADGKRRSSSEIKASTNILLETVGLSADLGDRFPHEMSGGQRQRLGVARALACRPDLIVCDEPVSALDVSIQAQIINLFEELKQNLNLTYIFIAHDMAVVRHIADVIAVMYLGKIVEMMDAVNLYLNPKHPYTIALLSAIPLVDYYKEQNRTRIVLDGEVPSPINVPSGCPFHPRCAYSKEECRQMVPQLRDLGNGHLVACHLVYRQP